MVDGVGPPKRTNVGGALKRSVNTGLCSGINVRLLQGPSSQINPKKGMTDLGLLPTVQELSLNRK